MMKAHISLKGIPKCLMHAICICMMVSVLFFTGSAPLRGQNGNGSDFEEFIKQLSEVAGKRYIAPISNSFTTDLNGGWFHRAPRPKKFSFNLEFGLIGMGTFYREVDKHFSTSGDFRFNSDLAAQMVEDLGLQPEVQQALIDKITTMDFTVDLSGATIIGDPDDHIKIVFNGADVTFTDPNTGQPRTETVPSQEMSLEFGGVEVIKKIPFFPFAAPQVGIGTILGTQAVFRYFPSIKIPDIGKLSFFGWGVQHNPGAWLPFKLPFDIALGYFQQNLKVGDILEANTTAYGVSASKRLGWGSLNITPYAGFMIEDSSIDVTYDFVVDDQTIPIEFKLKGENKNRFILGLSIRLFLLNLNADYNFGQFNSFTVGVMFAI